MTVLGGGCIDNDNDGFCTTGDCDEWKLGFLVGYMEIHHGITEVL